MLAFKLKDMKMIIKIKNFHFLTKIKFLLQFTKSVAFLITPCVGSGKLSILRRESAILLCNSEESKTSLLLLRKLFRAMAKGSGLYFYKNLEPRLNFLM